MALIWQPVSLIALVVAAYIGLKLPDVDQHVGLLLHRSIITHGPLLPLLAFAFAQGENPVQRRLAVGLAVGFAVHMAFDLFPRSWQGYALISIPGHGWIPSVASWAWIAATILVCMALSVKLVRHLADGLIVVLAVTATFLIAAGSERALWLPMLAIVASVAISYWIIKPTRKGKGKEEEKELQEA
jgi:hypothetical protein